jgi:hypothetical protein
LEEAAAAAERLLFRGGIVMIEGREGKATADGGVMDGLMFGLDFEFVGQTIL